KVITGIDVVCTGSDFEQLGPMLDQHQERYLKRPAELLVDGGFAKREQIKKAAAEGVTVYAPVMKIKGKAEDRYKAKLTDCAAVGAWRVRMGTDEAKELYKQRASSVELVNAHIRAQGLQQFNVRGREKVLAVTLWHALAYNLKQMVKLGYEELLKVLIEQFCVCIHAIRSGLRALARRLGPLVAKSVSQRRFYADAQAPMQGVHFGPFWP
ncbi:MAG TPA: hypothetical protein EYP10_06920, partial [Armatimonadetes bacterium]|nr:hypothetical protein [Armatimonadota bacterium]